MCIASRPKCESIPPVGFRRPGTVQSGWSPAKTVLMGYARRRSVILGAKTTHTVPRSFRVARRRPEAKEHQSNWRNHMAVGYGDGRVSIGITGVGRVAVTRVTAIPALTPRIRLDLAWTLGKVVRPGAGMPAEDYLLIDFGGELRMGADDLFVGTLARDGSRYPLRSLDYVDTQAGSLALDLGGHRLERLEEHRAGAALELRMQLWTRVEMGGGTTDARVEKIALQVPRDDWLAVLGALTGERVDLLEVRYDLVYAARYKASLKEVHLAREAVDRGDFNRAVLQARKAISLMEESVAAATGEDLRAALTDRIDERHANLYGGIVKRAKDMGNLTAHRPQAREYTRVEALFAVRLATITLEVVAGLLAA